MAALGIDEYLQSISFVPMIWLPKQEFSKRFGVSIPAIDGKIRDEKWKLGEVIMRDPDGKTHISVIGYQKWVESEWRKSEEKEAQFQRIAESSYYSSGGTIQSKGQTKNTGGASKQVKRRLKSVS
jgi:hypothetical protein